MYLYVDGMASSVYLTFPVPHAYVYLDGTASSTSVNVYVDSLVLYCFNLSTPPTLFRGVIGFRKDFCESALHDQGGLEMALVASTMPLYDQIYTT